MMRKQQTYINKTIHVTVGSSQPFGGEGLVKSVGSSVLSIFADAYEGMVMDQVAGTVFSRTKGIRSAVPVLSKEVSL